MTTNTSTTTTPGSNQPSFLITVRNIYHGQLHDSLEALKVARDQKNGALWQILCNLICHGAQVVYAGGYKRVKAKQFREDLTATLGLSEKQASKWVESISAGLGIRELRKGVQPIKGLDTAANEGIPAVEKFLNAMDIKTFNQFMLATREEPDVIAQIAKKVASMGPTQRRKLDELVAKMDKDERDAQADAAEEVKDKVNKPKAKAPAQPIPSTVPAQSTVILTTGEDEAA